MDVAMDLLAISAGTRFWLDILGRLGPNVCARAVTGYDDRSTAHLKGCKTNQLGDFVNGPSKGYERVHIIVDLSFCAHEGLFWL